MASKKESAVLAEKRVSGFEYKCSCGAGGYVRADQIEDLRNNKMVCGAILDSYGARLNQTNDSSLKLVCTCIMNEILLHRFDKAGLKIKSCFPDLFSAETNLAQRPPILLFPVQVEVHWVLVVVLINEGKRMLLLDSSQGECDAASRTYRRATKTVERIERTLNLIFKVIQHLWPEIKEMVPNTILPVPPQQDGVSCGVFVLHFAHLFVHAYLKSKMQERFSRVYLSFKARDRRQMLVREILKSDHRTANKKPMLQVIVLDDDTFFVDLPNFQGVDTMQISTWNHKRLPRRLTVVGKETNSRADPIIIDDSEEVPVQRQKRGRKDEADEALSSPLISMTLFADPPMVATILKERSMDQSWPTSSEEECVSLKVEDMRRLCHLWMCHFQQLIAELRLMSDNPDDYPAEEQSATDMALNFLVLSKIWNAPDPIASLRSLLQALSFKLQPKLGKTDESKHITRERVLTRKMPSLTTLLKSCKGGGKTREDKWKSLLLGMKQILAALNPGAFQPLHGYGFAKGGTPFERAVKILREKKRILVLTGAGISVAAGIPDFRTEATGLYRELQKQGLLCEDQDDTAVFDIETYKSDQKLALEAFKQGKLLQEEPPQPTPAHHFIRFLEQSGRLLRCYTQNIDGLDRTAGTERVFEVHGNLKGAQCHKCKKDFSIEEFKESIKKDTSEAPRCQYDGGVIRPNMVFFGESPDLREDLLEDDVKNADCLLVMGTSLSVTPFSKIPTKFKKRRNRNRSLEDTLPRIVLNLDRADFDDDDEFLFEPEAEVVDQEKGTSWQDTVGSKGSDIDLILEGDCQPWARLLQAGLCKNL